MAATILTNQIREGIVSALMKHRFEKEENKIAKDKRQLADDVYNTVYDAASRRKIASLPAGWLDEATQIKVQFGLKTVVYSMSKPRRILHKHAPNSSRYDAPMLGKFDAHHELTDRYVDIDRVQDDLDFSKKDLKGKTRAKLDSFRTVERLVEGWPDVKRFVPKPKPKIQLPAIPVKDLNAALEIA